VDRWNDLWVGGLDNRIHQKIDGLTASTVPGSAFSTNAGGYGGVIDANGTFWSVSHSPFSQSGTLRLPSPTVPPANWEVRSTGDTDVDGKLYGIALDPVRPYLWQTAEDIVFCWNTNGTPRTNANGLMTFAHGDPKARGLVVETNGHVWVAHGHDEYRETVGHLNANGDWVGNLTLATNGLAATYFANTNCEPPAVLAGLEGPVDFAATNNWPGAPVPTNGFSVRWVGEVRTRYSGVHSFFVSADAGAGFRLFIVVGGAQTQLIDNWNGQAQGEISGTQVLTGNTNYRVRLEYWSTSGVPQVRLSWQEPDQAKTVLPLSQLVQRGITPTGLSVDTEGFLWVGCRDSHSLLRIDPQAGPTVTNSGVVSRLGSVDRVVDLGYRDDFPYPYDDPARPYNYSDMTGFNNRIINPSSQPLKGYWTVIEDSGMAGLVWDRIIWVAPGSGSGAVEVWARAADERLALASEPFLATANGAVLYGLEGRFVEVRVGLRRSAPSNFVALESLTLHGLTSGFAGSRPSRTSRWVKAMMPRSPP